MITSNDGQEPPLSGYPVLRLRRMALIRLPKARLTTDPCFFRVENNISRHSKITDSKSAEMKGLIYLSSRLDISNTRSTIHT